MAVGNDLNGYLCGGVRLDHESYTHEEVVEKMRKGMHMLIRESCPGGKHACCYRSESVSGKKSQLLYR